MARHTTVTYDFLTLFGFLSLTISLFGCTGTSWQQHSASTDKTMPVEWTQELSMSSLLAEKPTVISQEDLSKLLAKPWYAGIGVKTNKVDESKILNNCNDFFAIKEPGMRAQQEQENDSLLEFKVMCEATRLLSQATPARYSNIPTNPLDAQLPTKLPKSIAFITSQSEWYRIQRNHNLTHWGDVYSIRKVEQKSANQSVYYLDSGAQTLAILGCGDINRDKRDDILVTVRDTVEGGSYFNLRLFVLTVTAQNQYQVVAEY
jgi:hypothetical protein